MSISLSYPIGTISLPKTITPVQVTEWIQTIALFPDKVKSVLGVRTDKELDTPYRPEGWTVRQVVHHCADSHMNCYIRFKWALTEDKPVIKAYDEKAWAELDDTRIMPVANSLQLIQSMHHRWVYLMQSMNREQWKRSFIHPDGLKVVTLEAAAGMYAWHCEHHLAHMKQALSVDKNE